MIACSTPGREGSPFKAEIAQKRQRGKRGEEARSKKHTPRGRSKKEERREKGREKERKTNCID